MKTKKLRRAALCTVLPVAAACGLALTAASPALANGLGCGTRFQRALIQVVPCVEVDGSGLYVTEIQGHVEWTLFGTIIGRLKVTGPGGFVKTLSVHQHAGFGTGKAGTIWPVNENMLPGKVCAVFQHYVILNGHYQWAQNGSGPACTTVRGRPAPGKPTYGAKPPAAKPPAPSVPSSGSTPTSQPTPIELHPEHCIIASGDPNYSNRAVTVSSTTNAWLESGSEVKVGTVALTNNAPSPSSVFAHIQLQEPSGPGPIARGISAVSGGTSQTTLGWTASARSRLAVTAWDPKIPSASCSFNIPLS